MSQKKIIARNVIWNWLGTFCDAAVGFIVAPFLVNSLGASMYGIWILIGSMSTYFGLFDLGIRSSIGRYIAYYHGEQNHKSVNDVLSTALAGTCALGSAVLVLLPAITAGFFRIFDVPAGAVDGVGTAIVLIMLNLALTFPFSLFDGVLWAHQRFDLLNMVDIPLSAARAGLTFWMISHGYGLAGLAALTLAVSVIAGFAKIILSFRINPKLRVAPRHVTKETARQLLGYSTGMFGITVSRMMRLQFTPLLIGWLLHPAAVTMYSIPKRLLDYTEKLFAAATGVLAPLSASLQAQKNDSGQQQIVIRGGGATIALSVLFLTFYLTMGRSLITLWMGPAWAGTYSLLVILALGEFLPLAQMTTWGMLLATARHKAQALFQLTDVVIAGSLAFALLGYGVSGLCMAIAISGAIFRGVAVLVHGCRAAGVPLKRYAAEAVAPGLLASSVPATVLVIATMTASPDNWAQFLAYVAAFAVMSVFACLAAAGFRRADVARIAAALRMRISGSTDGTTTDATLAARDSSAETQSAGTAVSSAEPQSAAGPAIARRIRSRVLRAALDAAGDTVGRGLLAPRYAGNGVIFMLHRVVPTDDDLIYPGYELSVSSLESALSFVRAAGWDIVSMDEVCRRLADGSNHRRFACFTFDDGYLDNYTLALPVFARYNAPMCVYICTGILDRSMAYWWGGLEALIARNNSIEISLPHSPEVTFSLETIAQKRRAYDLLDAACHRDPASVHSLESAFQRYRIDPVAVLDETALSVVQAREFAAHPLVTIGSHAATHQRLARLTDAEAQREIAQSRRDLEQMLEVPIRHIAYPFGKQDACGKREFDFARDAGYTSGVTTRTGNIRPEHRDRLWMLPRHTLLADRAAVRNCLYGTQVLLRPAAKE